MKAKTRAPQVRLPVCPIFQHYMYLLNNNEIQTYDITDKAHPALVHHLATDYGLETMYNPVRQQPVCWLYHRLVHP